MRQNVWVNEDGLRVGFGALDSINADAGEVHVKGLIKQLKCDINVKDLAAEVSQHMMQLPAASVLLKATFICNEGFDTAITIGTFDKDNAVIVSDGILTDRIPVFGEIIDCTGTQVGAMALEDLYIVASGLATVGCGQLLIQYIISNVEDV